PPDSRNFQLKATSSQGEDRRTKLTSQGQYSLRRRRSGVYLSMTTEMNSTPRIDEISQALRTNSTDQVGGVSLRNAAAGNARDQSPDRVATLWIAFVCFSSAMRIRETSVPAYSTATIALAIRMICIDQ